MSELLAVTTVGGAHPGTRAVSELSWPMPDFLPADDGWYVRVREYERAEDWPEAQLRGARYAWHPQPALPPHLPWLSVSRVRQPQPGEVRNWLTGLYYGEGGIMVRSAVYTVQYEMSVYSASHLLVNGLNIVRGDFWDEGVLMLRINWEGPGGN